jgi:hypothetical protein
MPTAIFSRNEPIAPRPPMNAETAVKTDAIPANMAVKIAI